MKVLAIIPARGGSARVPGKNTKLFAGKPLIVWTIEAALSCKGIDRIVVSTDSKEISQIAAAMGSEVIIRPADLANATIGIEPTLRHAYEVLREKESYKPDALALLLPTNPLRLPEHISEAIKIFKATEATSVVSVAEALGNNNPHWMLVRTESGEVQLFNGKSLKEITTRSQDLPPAYSRNDILYLLKPDNLYETPPNLYGKNVELYIMDDLFYSDINTSEDWEVTVDKFKRLRKKQ